MSSEHMKEVIHDLKRGKSLFAILQIVDVLGPDVSGLPGLDPPLDQKDHRLLKPVDWVTGQLKQQRAAAARSQTRLIAHHS